MTITFDAIWIPMGISALGLAWAAFMLHGEPGEAVSMLGWPPVLGIALGPPLVASLAAWLIWALFT